MANLTDRPKQSNFEVVLSQPIDSSTTTIVTSDVPDYASGGETVRVTILNPKGVEHFTATGWNSSTNTWTGVTRGVASYTGGPSTARAHPAGVKVIIGNPWQLYDDINTSLDSKLDKTGDTMTGPLGVYVVADLATLQSEYPSPTNGYEAYATSEGKFYDATGGSWVARESGGTFANMSETVAGKGELATLSEQGAQTSTGGTGAPLVLASANTLKAPATYTPAYLTGGTNAQSTAATWAAVTDGSFRITVDGTAYNVDGIDFTGDATMADVASTIQTALRAQTSGSETVVWSTDHFVITSVDTTASSQVSVTDTSTGTVGTDISGAGAADWMDCDTGNGTATAAVLDQTQDENKIPVFGSDGKLNSLWIPDSTPVSLVAGENIDGTTTPVAVYISDGSNGRTAGRVYKADADDQTNMAVRFIGFVTDNVTTGSAVSVYTSGTVPGFTGLTQGIKYFLSTTAGAIAANDFNASVSVGYAISATQILIQRESLVIQATHSTALTAGTMPLDVQTSLGFRPKAIIAIMGDSDTADASTLSILHWAGGTNSGASIGTDDENDSAPAFTSGNQFRLWTDNAASTSAEYYFLVVQSVDDTSFTVRWDASGSVNNVTADVNYLIFG